MRSSAIIFAVLTVAIPAALYGLGPARLYAALRTDGARVSGVVVTSTCGKHVEYQYSFAAAGSHYSGVGSASPEQCPKFAPGAQVPVVYLPADPAQNFYGDPAVAYKNDLIFTALVTLLAPGLITIAFNIVRRTHA